jgi:hypothetical protein
MSFSFAPDPEKSVSLGVSFLFSNLHVSAGATLLLKVASSVCQFPFFSSNLISSAKVPCSWKQYEFVSFLSLQTKDLRDGTKCLQKIDALSLFCFPFVHQFYY